MEVEDRRQTDRRCHETLLIGFDKTVGRGVG